VFVLQTLQSLGECLAQWKLIVLRLAEQSGDQVRDGHNVLRQRLLLLMVVVKRHVVDTTEKKKLL
jgi:hypothetical protein